MFNSPRRNKSEPWDGFLVPPRRRKDLDARGLCGKRILVSGAGGYIGSALARQLASLELERLVLLDIAEQGLFLLDHDLQQSGVSGDRSVLIGSVCDAAMMDRVFAEHRPHIVFHVAAYKHVVLMEMNPFAAVGTNVLGTNQLLQTARRYAAEQCIVVSTDKAVDPISIMGATKRLAEQIVLANTSPTRMKALRLCNVIGSSGSVAPLFCEQIAAGKPVTVTDPDATRYFISIQDAVYWLMQCTDADIPDGLYIPPAGEPYLISELAKYLMRSMTGLASEKAIVYTGLRVGDKLHESMTSSREQAVGDDDGLRRVTGPCLDEGKAAKMITELAMAVREHAPRRLLQVFESALPEYAMTSLMRSFVHSVEERTS